MPWDSDRTSLDKSILLCGEFALRQANLEATNITMYAMHQRTCTYVPRACWKGLDQACSITQELQHDKQVLGPTGVIRYELHT